MPLKALHHHENTYVWCGTSLSACEACDHKCQELEQLRFVWAFGVNGDDDDHYHHDDMSVSVTETLYCLRKEYLKRTMDYAESPAGLAARATGTAKHKARESVNKDGCSEVTLTLALSRGYTLCGTADRLTDEYIMDYKTMDAERKTVDVQHEDQLSIYGEMARLRDGKVRRLLLAQDTRRGLKTMDVEPVPEALDTCVYRAEQLITALVDATPLSLPALGREIRHHAKRHCDFCPAEIRTACEEMDQPGGE